MKNNGLSGRSTALDTISNCGKRPPLISVSESIVIKPDYIIKSFGNELYNIVKFKRSGEVNFYLPKEEQKTNDHKLDNNYARARSMVRQFGFCNPWSYFATFTLDPNKYDRYDLDMFRKDLMQWIRNTRKRYSKLYPDTYTEKLSVLIVPENHSDGAWHMHGLINGLPPEVLSKFEVGKHPDKLVRGDYLNWPDYAEKFGFCSLGVIRDQIRTVCYLVKYITKNLTNSDQLGEHLYFHSRPLRKAEPVAYGYGNNVDLDSLLDWHGQFCSTGMARSDDWLWPVKFFNCELICDDLPVRDYLEPVPEPQFFDPTEIDPTYENFSLW